MVLTSFLRARLSAFASPFAAAVAPAAGHSVQQTITTILHKAPTFWWHQLPPTLVHWYRLVT